jgi:hypothetical protein
MDNWNGIGTDGMDYVQWNGNGTVAMECDSHLFSNRKRLVHKRVNEVRKHAMHYYYSF